MTASYESKGSIVDLDDSAKRKGGLADHQRRGKKYLPPMAQLPIEISDSFKSEAPNFLWPAVLWVLGGDDYASQLCRLQRDLSDQLGEQPHEVARLLCFDGKMSTLELWTHEQRTKHRQFLIERISALALLPDDFLAVLRLYHDVPGTWLLIEPWQTRSIEIPTERTLDILARALIEWAKQDHVNALAKFLTFTWGALRRTFSADPLLIDHLKDYPTVPAKVAATETMIRAAYGSWQGLAVHKKDPAIEVTRDWAKRFWDANWGMTDCAPADDLSIDAKLYEAPAKGGDGGPMDALDDSPLEEASGRIADYDMGHIMPLVEQVEGELRRFRDAYFNTTERRLYDTQGDEVIAGLTMRALKSIASLIRAPHQWSTPFAAGTFRLLAETEIMFAWFQAHPDDYDTYQKYGRGREKLGWLHVEDMIDSLNGEIPEELSDVVEHLNKRKREASPLDVTVVSIESTFNGVSMRKMAGEVGLAQLYRTVYQSSSAILHGEWGPIETHDLTRCINPLHRFHLIPSFKPPWVEDERIPKLLLKELNRVVSQSVAMLGSGHGGHPEG